MLIVETQEECYINAMKKKEQHQYEQALKFFNAIKDYKDVALLIVEIEKIVIEQKYILASKYKNDKKKIFEAMKIFSEIRKYKDSYKKLEECIPVVYKKALSLKKNKDYYGAFLRFQLLAEFVGCDYELGLCEYKMKKNAKTNFKKKKKK